jgi:glycine betaine/proline transport system permease protein
MEQKSFDVILDKAIDNGVDWLNETFSSFFSFFNSIISGSVSVVESSLLWIPFYIIIVVFGYLAWRSAGRGLTLMTVIGFLFCYLMNLWQETMITMAIVLVATLAALVVAIPFGILAALNQTANKITRPVMDFLQTMPPYVYLIPAIALLGFGRCPAVVATAIVALPPTLRLTNLGIRQVPPEQLEVGRAFGASSRQILLKIQIPHALPTIMAGINQSLMLALSMAVIAGIIGAGGLGKNVYAAIRYLEIGKAFDAGLAIVILAIILDRISQASINLFRKGPQ